MIIIYSEHITNRLKYVADFIFKDKNILYSITDSETVFKTSDAIKINYSKKELEANLSFIPQGILFETEIKTNYKVEYCEDVWMINGFDDVFSIIFYFLSRYEEYVNLERDEHDRFSAKNSFIFKSNRLSKPNVDLIVKLIFELLNLDYDPILNRYDSVITFDIDSAWAYKNKGIFRSLLSDTKDLTKGKCIKDKFKVRLNKKQDPFDTFSIIKKIASTHQVICFFLMGDWSRFDKNINWKNIEFKRLIKDVSSYCEIGIHPSYKSYLNKDMIYKEINRLKVTSGKEILKSRQHYLKLKLPNTYRQLIDLGIKEDYSMGFADAFGFRAGTCFPFYFYDLIEDKQTDLEVFPITYMDGTLNKYLGLSIDDSIKVVRQLKKEVKSVGGIFIPLWHNETIAGKGQWKGWYSVFESNF
jgi:hypothetical protein